MEPKVKEKLNHVMMIFSQRISDFLRNFLSFQFLFGASTTAVFLLFLKVPEYNLSDNNCGVIKEKYATESGSTLSNVTIFCMVLTMPENHEKKAVHVKNTWGKRCNKLLFISSKNDVLLASIDLGYADGRENLWRKTRKSFKYVHDRFLNDYDWFLKADDDTYVILENLRYLVSSYKPNEDPIYFGRRIKYPGSDYMSGGAGYVLSRLALQLVVAESLSNPHLCPEYNIDKEDVEMSKCLKAAGVVAGDSRDSDQRGRFFPLTPRQHLVPGDSEMVAWYKNNVYYSNAAGQNCCSDLAISFHYVKPDQMHELEYLIYRLHPYGVKYSDPIPHSGPHSSTDN